MIHFQYRSTSVSEKVTCKGALSIALHQTANKSNTLDWHLIKRGGRKSQKWQKIVTIPQFLYSTPLGLIFKILAADGNYDFLLAHRNTLLPVTYVIDEPHIYNMCSKPSKAWGSWVTGDVFYGKEQHILLYMYSSTVLKIQHYVASR